MKKNYGLLTGCLVVAALGVIYAGVGAYQAHTKEKEQQQAENEKIYMTNFSEIKAVSYDNDGNVLAFTKDGDSWTYDGDDQYHPHGFTGRNGKEASGSEKTGGRGRSDRIRPGYTGAAGDRIGG